MKLNLKRWRNRGIHGIWPVKQLPGVVIANDCAGKKGRRGTWHIMQFGEGPYSLKPGMQKIHDTWGTDWEPAPETSRAIVGLQEGYPTRRAALIALEEALAKKQPGALGEVITG